MTWAEAEDTAAVLDRWKWRNLEQACRVVATMMLTARMGDFENLLPVSTCRLDQVYSVAEESILLSSTPEEGVKLDLRAIENMMNDERCPTTHKERHKPR